MLHSNLVSFILNHFINAKLASVILFHCWGDKAALYRFSLLSSQYSLYSQYIYFNDSDAVIDFAPRFMRHNRPKIGAFIDLNCKHTNYVIDKSSHQHLFNYRYHWLIYDERSNFSSFYEIFKNVNLSVDTQLSYVVPMQPVLLTANKTTFIALDVYSNGRFIGGSLNVTPSYEIQCLKTGCHNINYLSDLHKRPLYGHREILREVTMRVAVVVTRFDLKAAEEEILKYLLTEKDFHIDPIARFGMQVLLLLKDSLHTKVAYTYYDRWTDADTKGGAVGALIDNKVDLTSTPFFHTRGRFQYLTAIAQTGSSRSVCMFRTPRYADIQGRAFLDPFSTKVWITFVTILALSGLLLWLIFIVEFHQMKKYFQFVPSLLTTCLISFGSACAQASFLIPVSLAGRFTFISLSLISFIMYNYYTSVVVSSLLGSPVKSKIKTLGDLADSNLDIGLEPLPYTYTYLNFSTLPVVRHFVKRKIETRKDAESLWYATQDGINKMRYKPGFVFIFEAQSGYYMIENQYEPHEICDLNEISFRSDSLLSIHLQKNSSYKELVRLKIMRIMESGVYAKHRRLWIRTSLNCLSNSFLLTVGMEYAAPIFLMLLSCYLIVLMIFVMEIAWHRYTVSRNRITINKKKVEEN